MRTASRRALSAAILGGATAAGLSLAFAMPAAASDALSDSTLSRVQQGQVLKVCTTGDYAPFSHREDNGDFEGIDIDMAASLAKSLGATVQTVPTSWPTLMEDFTSGKCDIAMSGISVKLDRQAQAYFSQPYQTGGKTPIVRCEDVDCARMGAGPAEGGERVADGDVAAVELHNTLDVPTTFAISCRLFLYRIGHSAAAAPGGA